MAYNPGTSQYGGVNRYQGNAPRTGNPQGFTLPTYQSAGYNPYGTNGQSSSPWTITGQGTGPTAPLAYRDQGRSGMYGGTYNPYGDTGRDPGTGQQGPQYDYGQAEYSKLSQEPTQYQTQPLSPWNPTYPNWGQTSGEGGGQQQSPSTPATNQGWQNMPGMDLSAFEKDDFREQALEYMQSALGYNQFMQNQYQYGQDFNEAQRRWNEQFGYQQGLDRYNMDLTTRQQQAAEWQAQQAAQQWAQQFGYQQEQDRFSQGLANRQFGLSEYQTTEGLRQSDWLNQQNVGLRGRELDITQANNQARNELERYGIDTRAMTEQQVADLQAQTQRYGIDIGAQTARERLGLDTTIANQQYDLGQGRLGLDRDQLTYQNQWNMGRLGLDERLGMGRLGLDERTAQQQYELGQGRLGLDREQMIQQRELTLQAQQIERAYNEGRLSNEQRQLALGELTERNRSMQAERQMTMQEQELARRYGLDERQLNEMITYRNAQMAQEKELNLARLAQERDNATLAAYGRNQRPQARWMRNF